MNIRSIAFIASLLPTLALTIEAGPSVCSSCMYVSSGQTPLLKEQIDNVFEATNKVRADKRRTILQRDPKLMTAAQQYAELMAAQEEMSHTIGGLSLPDKAQRVGYAYSRLSENIALNTDLDGRFVVYEQWMKSKGHRQNLLATDVSQIGVGIAGPGKRTKRYYYCQIFGAPLSGKAQ